MATTVNTSQLDQLRKQVLQHINAVRRSLRHRPLESLPQGTSKMNPVEIALGDILPGFSTTPKGGFLDIPRGFWIRIVLEEDGIIEGDGLGYNLNPIISSFVKHYHQEAWPDLLPIRT